MTDNDIAGRAIAIISPKRKAFPTPKVSRADVAGIVEAEHGKYRIKAGQLAGVFVARAFPKSPSRAQGLIAQAEGDTEEAAIEALRAKIKARDVSRKEVRRWDELAHVAVPSEEEFVEALHQSSLSQTQIAMLKAHAIAREKGLTMDQLARAAGYKSRDTATKIFGKTGDLIADYLGVESAAHMLGVAHSQGEERPPVWVMHQELRDAVRLAL